MKKSIKTVIASVTMLAASVATINTVSAGKKHQKILTGIAAVGLIGAMVNHHNKHHYSHHNSYDQGYQDAYRDNHYNQTEEVYVTEEYDY